MSEKSRFRVGVKRLIVKCIEEYNAIIISTIIYLKKIDDDTKPMKNPIKKKAWKGFEAKDTQNTCEAIKKHTRVFVISLVCWYPRKVKAHIARSQSRPRRGEGSNERSKSQQAIYFSFFTTISHCTQTKISYFSTQITM